MEERLLILLGPTAVGKTAVGIALAEALDGEIISADSGAVYRGLDIGTAKPATEEQQRVRFHLIDVADPDEVFTAARFRELALQAIESIRARGKRVLIVGGTGLYLRALLHGFRLAPPPSEPELRTRLQAECRTLGTLAMHERLKRIDPIAGARIHPNDAVRIIRALEVYEMTGIPLSQWQQREEKELPALKVGLTMPREQLYARIDTRIDAMLAQGFVQEVQNLLQKGYNTALPALKGLGYRQIIEYLQGRIVLEEAIRIWKRDTRRFAKRQMTWFRKEPAVHWLDASENAEKTAQKILTLIEEQGGL